MALTILIKFFGFIVHSKPSNMTCSAFPGKIPETRKIVFNFLSVLSIVCMLKIIQDFCYFYSFICNIGYRLSKYTDNAQNVVRDVKLIIFQDGTPVRNRTIWALQSIEVSVSHVVNKQNMCNTSICLHYNRGSVCVPPTSVQRLLRRRC